MGLSKGLWLKQFIPNIRVLLRRQEWWRPCATSPRLLPSQENTIWPPLHGRILALAMRAGRRLWGCLKIYKPSWS